MRLGAIFLILSGAGILLSGNKVIKNVVASIVRVIFASLLMMYFYKKGWFAIIDPTSSAMQKTGSVFLVLFGLVIAFYFGLGAAWAFKKWYKLGPALVGAILAHFLAVIFIVFLNGAGLVLSGQQEWVSQIAGITITFVTDLIGLTIGVYFSFLVIIATQTFFGSYLLIRGIGLWFYET